MLKLYDISNHTRWLFVLKLQKLWVCSTVWLDVNRNVDGAAANDYMHCLVICRNTLSPPCDFVIWCVIYIIALIRVDSKGCTEELLLSSVTGDFCIFLWLIVKCHLYICLLFCYFSCWLCLYPIHWYTESHTEVIWIFLRWLSGSVHSFSDL